MFRGLVTLAVLAAPLSGAASAQADVYQPNAPGESSVTVSERIRVSVPERVALHLQEDSWDLSLAAPPLGAVGGSGYREGCHLVPKGDARGLEALSDAARAGELLPVSSYPAVVPDLDGGIDTGPDGAYLKGTLLCLNAKILQKFCNGEACELDVKVRRSLPAPKTAASYGQFFVSDEPIGYDAANFDRYDRFFDVTGTPGGDRAVAHEFFYHEGRLPGWLDDLVYEGFWFDGTEEAGKYKLDVKFLLVGF